MATFPVNKVFPPPFPQLYGNNYTVSLNRLKITKKDGKRLYLEPDRMGNPMG
jgi:hypothetical protein